jgi:uncharacterized membrane protein
MAAEDRTSFKFADLNLSVSVEKGLICFTRNVTSNNAGLDLIGTSDVEELRSMMQINNIYLEIVPTDVSYEILIQGKDKTVSDKNYSELSSEELKQSYNDYIATYNHIENNSVTEDIQTSELLKINDVDYIVTNVKSVANNDKITYLKKYYTIHNGKVINFTLQTNGKEIDSNMSKILLDIVSSGEYKTIKKSVFDNGYLSELLSTLLRLIIPIAVLALIVFIVNRSTKKTKKQIEAEEKAYKERYAKESHEKETETDKQE